MKRYFIVLIAFVAGCFFAACSSDYNNPPGKQDPLNFDETKKTIDYKMQTATFTAERAFWGVGYLREIINSDTLTYNTSSHLTTKEAIEGDWYRIRTESKTVIVTVSENQSDKTRKLILDVDAGNTGATLNIIQNKK